MLAVLTMWPRYAGSLAAASSIIGVNRRTPCTTPHRSTPEHPFPVGDAVLPHQSAGADAGVVEDEVRRAEALLHRLGERVHLRRVGDVDLARQHLRAGGFHLGLRPVERILLHVDQHEVHAAGRADARAFEAEAGAGAGENGRRALEVLDHLRVSFRLLCWR